jgi:hypothetical protein
MSGPVAFEVSKVFNMSSTSVSVIIIYLCFSYEGPSRSGKKQIRRKKRIHKRAKQTNLEAHWVKFRKSRNICNKLILNAKTKYYSLSVYVFRMRGHQDREVWGSHHLCLIDHKRSRWTFQIFSHRRRNIFLYDRGDYNSYRQKLSTIDWDSMFTSNDIDSITYSTRQTITDIENDRMKKKKIICSKY